MPFDILTIPCREDNYAFLIHDGSRTALVDAPEAAPILAALEQKGWTLDEVWLTHHHFDHVDGLPALRSAFPDLQVTGCKADADRLPPLDRAVSDGDTFQFGGADVHVMDVSGHTINHIAFHMPSQQAVFTADSLMALGCGRVFEGTMPQMWQSLCKLRDLPDDTIVYSGHEYTSNNADFALTIEPDNQALQARVDEVRDKRARGEATVPSTLRDERATNPFLRAHLQPVKDALSMQKAEDADVFAEIRSRKDRF
ncbi:hydroxyacylglutathione hydrolase [Maribius pontilimi]|uniref:Hydroxyacylglutathione hydrolase n=1 Tax=Palleronia pontilimi TaxID=1964209 RepID=A0A934IFE8_9RHOB|nr:hydroxyacylglutathione hydrolase [Palleronia pontilimi]MBJ3763402.1 hydroxyacylglutathione hydrolase [Palleronia pontilimi]